MTKMRLSILPVGQGTGTLIQLLDDGTGLPTEAMLIDLGTAKWEKTATGFASATYVVNQLKLMPEPTLSAVFLSHGDEDHINLVPRMLAEFHAPSDDEPRSGTLEVQNVWFGGARSKYKKYGNQILTLLNNYRATDSDGVVHELGNGESTGRTPLYTSPGGVEVYLVFGNAIAAQAELVLAGEATSADNSKDNTVSLVLLVRYGGQTFVLPGDATCISLAQCNQVLDFFDYSPLKPALHMSLPHHGSPRTTFALIDAFSKSDQTLAEYVVEYFVDAFEASSVSASAGEVESFRLPGTKVMEAFCTHTERGWYTDPQLAGTDQHFYTAYFNGGECPVEAPESDDSGEDDEEMSESTWPTRANFYSARTTRNFFSTDYLRRTTKPQLVPWAFPGYETDLVPPPDYTATPPWMVGWAFLIEANVDPAIFRIDDIVALGTAHRVALEALYGPLPADQFVFVPSAHTVSAPEPLAAEQTPAPSPAVVVTAGARRPASSPRSRRVRPLP